MAQPATTDGAGGPLTEEAAAEEAALLEAARARVGVTTVHTVIGDEATAPATLGAGLRDGGCRGGPAWTSDDGAAAPRLLSVMAGDPDANDFVYSAGDTVTLTFDAPTDRGGAAAAGGNKAYVDRLVSFSDVLAYDYSGTWNEGTTVSAGRTDVRPPLDYSAPPTYLASGGALLWRPPATVFTITILQATCPGCTPMPGLASVKPHSDTEIKTRSHSSTRAFGVSPLLTGD